MWSVQALFKILAARYRNWAAVVDKTSSSHLSLPICFSSLSSCYSFSAFIIILIPGPSFRSNADISSIVHRDDLLVACWHNRKINTRLKDHVSHTSKNSSGYNKISNCSALRPWYVSHRKQPSSPVELRSLLDLISKPLFHLPIRLGNCALASNSLALGQQYLNTC